MPLDKLPIPEEVSFTFADYSELSADVEDVASHFGLGLTVKACDLPFKDVDGESVRQLKRRLLEDLPFVSLTNETARREFLIAPVLFEAVHHTHARIRVEYALEVDNQLKGTLDYLLRSPRGKLLVVEAKQGDLQRGFNQLTVELVALDRWLEDDEAEILWGVVSMGDAWRFGFLDRGSEHLTQDLRLYTVPDDLERLVGTLVAILADEG